MTTAPCRRMARSGSGLAAALVFLALGLPLHAQTICDIQGSGPETPLAGALVTTSGMVTADLASAGLGGFFMQAPGCDSDPATSDALWVSAPREHGPLAFGVRVTVTGRVVELEGLTTLEAERLRVESGFPGSVEVVTLAIPQDARTAATYLEAREGMLVALPRSRVVAATDHAGEAFVMPEATGVTRVYRGSEDQREIGVSRPGGWLALDHGDLAGGVGILTDTGGGYRVLAPSVLPLELQRLAAAPTAAAPAESGTISVATYNLTDFFDPIDDPGVDDTGHTPSSAGYAAGLARRASSIARLLGAPDLLGVQEVEKLEVLEDLAAAPELAGASYQALLFEGPGPQGIDVGLLYSSRRLRLRSAEAHQGCTDLDSDWAPPCGPNGGGSRLLFARPPLVVRLERVDTAQPLTVVVNHFESRQGDEERSASLRRAQAEHLARLVREIKLDAPLVPILVLGDLADFEDSQTLGLLTAKNLLIDLHSLPGGERPYTSVVQGVSQTLDYILVEPGLLPRVARFGVRHINVDFAHPGPEGSSHRASDHDPVLLHLRLGPVEARLDAEADSLTQPWWVSRMAGRSHLPVPEWWNWQTRTFEGRVGRPVRVRIPPPAPTSPSAPEPYPG